jgi:hypothetical protein
VKTLPHETRSKEERAHVVSVMNKVEANLLVNFRKFPFLFWFRLQRLVSAESWLGIPYKFTHNARTLLLAWYLTRTTSNDLTNGHREVETHSTRHADKTENEDGLLWSVQDTGPLRNNEKSRVSCEMQGLWFRWGLGLLDKRTGWRALSVVTFPWMSVEEKRQSIMNWNDTRG